MKKFFKYLGAILAGTLVISSCTREEIVTLNPEDGTAQTLGEIKGCTLNADGDAITTTYTEVDFGLDVPTIYSLNIAAHSAEEINTNLSATISDGKISFAQKDLNAALLNMGAEADVEFALDFQLVASPATDKGAVIATYTVCSNVVTASFVPYSTTVLDADKYDHIWIIGAAESIGAWDHGKVFQYLYNYNGDGNTYSGMIYYTDGAAGGWKLTGIAGWDDSCNWGSESQAEESEASSITLISSGGSKDIKCYSLPYYMWTFDKSTLTLKKEFGFTTMGIVGAFNEWNPADENCVMAYNAQYHRFYIDYDFAADTELKFTADGKWDLNFGTDMEQNGGNIAVTAGKYRIYLDFNKNEYTFDENMYGKEEPGMSPSGGENEKPEPVDEVWGIVGDAVGSWDNDVVMESDGTYHYVKGQVLADGKFKFRLNAAWTTNFGADAFEVDKEMTLISGGSDIIAVAGTYDIYLDPENAKAWFITDGSYPGGNAPSTGKAVRVFCAATGWDVTNLYGWGGALEFSWPGVAAEGTATLAGNEYSYWTLDAANYGATNVGLIFNNGSVQTVDITPVTLDGDKCYKVGEAGGDGKLAYEELALPVIRITYKNEAGWDKVSIYGWGDLGDFGGWPGAEMTKEGDVWVYDIPVEHFGKSTSLIFNNAGQGAQTVDLGPFTLNGDLVFDNSNAAIK